MGIRASTREVKGRDRPTDIFGQSKLEKDTQLFLQTGTIFEDALFSLFVQNLYYSPFMGPGIHDFAAVNESDGLLPSRCLLSAPC